MSNGSPVTIGLVSFCDASATFCNNSALIGTAQLSSFGTAAIKFVPGGGSHSYKAVFSGTAADGASTSPTQVLTVTGKFSSTTAVASSGSSGNYSLTGTVVGTGSGSLAPGGSVSFLDTTSSNHVLGVATLGPASLAHFFGTLGAYASDNHPQSVAVGDFNRDGIPDLAAVNNGSNTVSVLLRQGDGSFQARATFSVGGAPSAVAVGDFNADGKPDLVVTNNSDGTISVLLGKGDGTFEPQATYGLMAGYPQSVVVGDFNNDGISDLAVATTGNNAVAVLQGVGNGTFQLQGSFITGKNPQSLAVGDFNGDGYLDLVAANCNNNTIGVLLGNGDLSFQSAVSYTVGSNPQSVATGDFNGDGVLDVAIANYGDATLGVLLGNGDGTFKSQVTYVAGLHPFSVAAGDLNGDGKADLAVANFDGATVSVYFGNGDGTFQTQVTHATGTNPIAPAIADLNGDGIADLALADYGDNNVGVLLSSVTQTATATLSGVSIPGPGDTPEIGAEYSGDANFAASTSSTIQLTSSQVATTLELSASPTSSTYGQQVALTATLTPGVPDGETITFKSGSTIVGTATTHSGVATLNVSSIPAGTNGLTAVYEGDGTYLGSTSSALSFAVSKATPSITWANPASITYGTALSGTQLNASTPVAGSFVYTPAAGSTLAAGDHTLSVTFTPTDTANYTSVTATVPLTVVAPPMLSVAFGPSQIALNGSSTLTFAITNPSANTVALSGLGFVDSLPAGLVVATPSDLANTCGGTATALEGSQSVSLSGGNLGTNSTCSVRVTVTSAVSSGYTNTSGAVTSANGGTGNSSYADLLVASGITLSGGSINFGSQVVGTTSSSQTVQLTNNYGSVLTLSSVLATGDFAQTNDCGSTLLPAANCTLTVTFTPSASGSRSGAVILTDSAGTQVVLLSGTGNAPGVGLSPTSVNFGTAVVRVPSSPRTISVTNTGSSALTISSITASGDFAYNSEDCTTLAQGGQCSIQVTFTPTNTGARTGTLTIVDNSGTQVVALSGTGNAPGVGLTASTIEFGSQTVGTSSNASSVILSNNGDSDLTLTSFTAGGDFSVTSPDCALPKVLAPSATCTLQVVFRPTATGGRNGTVTIADSLGTHVIALSGTGSAPGVSFASSTLNFGSVTVGDNSQLTATINLDASTAAALNVTGVSASGDYSVVNNCTSLVAPGSSCSLSVTFSPATVGVRAGAVLVDYSIGGISDQLVLMLTGTGVAPGVGLGSSTISFGSQVVGTTSGVLSVTVTNTGTSSLTIGSVVASGDFGSAGDCVIASPLAPNATCSVNVTFTPSAAGTRTGVVAIKDTTGATHVIALSVPATRRE